MLHLLNFYFVFMFQYLNQIKKWKSWELETTSLEYQFSNGNSSFIIFYFMFFFPFHSICD